MWWWCHWWMRTPWLLLDFELSDCVVSVFFGVWRWEREKSKVGKRRFVCPAPTHVVVPSFFYHKINNSMVPLALALLGRAEFYQTALGHVNRRCSNRYIMLAMSVCTYWQLSYHHFLCTGSPSPGVDTARSFYLLYRYSICIFWYNLEAWLEVLLYIKLALAILYSFILWLWPICLIFIVCISMRIFLNFEWTTVVLHLCNFLYGHCVAFQREITVLSIDTARRVLDFDFADWVGL